MCDATDEPETVVSSGFRTIPERSGAGVLMTRNGVMYLVLTPCTQMAVDAVAMRYAPPGAAPGTERADPVVVRYLADVPMAAADVLVPLTPPSEPPPGWTLVESDEALLG